MSRPLRVETTLDMSPRQAVQAFRLTPDAWLPRPHEQGEGPRFRMYLWSGRLGVLVDVTVAAARRDRGCLRRLVRLQPDPLTPLGRRVPAFVGDIVVSDRDGVAVCALDGSYQPPYGPIGDLADGLLLQPLARRTARRFLAELAEGLQAAAVLPRTVDA